MTRTRNAAADAPHAATLRRLARCAVAAGVFAALAGPSLGAAGAGGVVRLPDHRAFGLRCSGSGSPTVILEAGFGAGANAWSAVQPRIAAVTRVCAYDRAGYGLSDPGPMPRDGQAIARDLDHGLRAAGIKGPYVLVGHSAGALYARIFAARRRRDVVGLVFVDPSVDHQTRRYAALFGQGAGSLDGIRRRPAHCLEVTMAAKAPGAAVDLEDCAPARLDAEARRIALRPETWRTQVSELDTLFATTSDEVDRTRPVLRQVPAIVLTAAGADGPAVGAEESAAGAWQGFHAELAAQFDPSEHRLVKSSHMMMFDRPEVVAGAAIALVQRARRR